MPKKQFKKEVHCSPRAMEFLKAEPSKDVADNEVYESTFESMINLSGNLQKCYRDSLILKPAQSYNVCVVLQLDKKGMITFLDIDDHSKEKNVEMQKCMQNTFETADFSKLQELPVIIVQPIALHPKKP